jgi:Domain of unknown function (DUF4189)
MRRLPLSLAFVVMVVTLIAIAVATGASAAPKQQSQQEFYGVLYFGKVSQTASDVYWGTGTSEASADQATYNTCQQAATNCKMLVWVYNGWVALVEGEAQGGGSTLTYSWDRTEPAVVDKVLTSCREAGATGCRVVGTWNTAFDPNKPTTGAVT